MVRPFIWFPPLHVRALPLWGRRTPSPKWAELWWSFQCWRLSTFLYRALAFSAAGTCSPGLAFTCLAKSSIPSIESIWYEMEDVNGIYPKGRWPGCNPPPCEGFETSIINMSYCILRMDLFTTFLGERLAIFLLILWTKSKPSLPFPLLCLC